MNAIEVNKTSFCVDWELGDLEPRRGLSGRSAQEINCRFRFYTFGFYTVCNHFLTHRVLLPYKRVNSNTFDILACE